jgi:hypothetical protein
MVVNFYIHPTNLDTSKSKEQLIDLEWSLQLCFSKHEKILQNVICLCEIQ